MIKQGRVKLMKTETVKIYKGQEPMDENSPSIIFTMSYEFVHDHE